MAPCYVVKFAGPFSANTGTFDFDFPAALVNLRGLYLWTVEYESGFLVNYVGKTDRSFSARFWDHNKWSESGKDICDPDCMPKGENWLLDEPTSDQKIRLYACYRIFLAPLNVDDAVLLKLESAIIQTLLAAGGKCASFLGNKQKVKRDVLGHAVLIETQRLIHGLGKDLLI